MDSNKPYQNLGREAGESSARRTVWLSVVCALLSLFFFVLTAFRTITWWDSSSYSVSSVTLGINPPPGSFLLAVIGWVVTRIPWGLPEAFVLNLLAGLFGAVTVGIVVVIAVRLDHVFNRYDGSAVVSPVLVVGTAAAALAYAFSETLWLYAIKFTPYMLTVLFTSMIIWAMVRWWESADDDSSYRWLLLVAILFGLDFSVHRTNLLILPGLLVWVWLRKPNTLWSRRAWGYGLAGFLGGLAFHFLIIPVAASNPFMNFGDASSLSRFYDYVSLKQMGGGWLVKLYPRKAPFWSYQIVDYLRVVRDSFFTTDGPLGVLGLIPGILGMTGLGFILRRSWRLGVGLVVLFLLSSLGAVIYFNIPDNFFRTFERHYMPSLVIFAIWMVYGVGALLSFSGRVGGWFKYAVTGLVLAGVIAGPFNQIFRNYERVDGSRSYLAYDYAVNMLGSLAPDAILFTSGDNDTFTTWYLQVAEGYRSDVTVCNTSLLNTSWYPKQVRDREADFPLSSFSENIDPWKLNKWPDTVIAIPISVDAAALGLKPGTSVPDSLFLPVPPTLADRYLLPQDQVLLDVILTNGWKRPIYLSSPPSWLVQYTRQEGIAARLIPLDSIISDLALQRDILFNRCVYRGYNDPSVPLDATSITVAQKYLNAFLRLAVEAIRGGDADLAAEVMTKMLELFPPDRVEPSDDVKQTIQMVTEYIAEQG